MSCFKRRLCRVCMANEWNGNLVPIFQNQAKSNTASDIFAISGVQILDLPAYPALICIKCIEDLSNAILFRNRCRNTDQIFKDTLLNQNISYGNFEFKNEQDSLNVIKTEPVETETFSYFEEYSSLNPETVLDEEAIDLNGTKYWCSADRKVKQFECTYCKEQLQSESSLMSHIKTSHSGKVRKRYSCKFCGKKFAFKTKYIQHRTSHFKESSTTDYFGCHYCLKQFDQKTSLKYHIRCKHEVYDFICDGCGKSFTLKNKLIKHFRDEHIIKSLPKKERIKREVKETQCFPCVVCGKICGSKTFLKVHEKSHIKVRPEDYFYCDLCGNKFRSKNPLELHIKTRHILKLRYTCDKCPGKSWARKDHMKRHVKVVHENIREFKCEWCGKDFPERRKLECHLRIHTGEQPFSCQFCGKKYTHETDYRRHIWSHTGERKYKCTSCRIAFNKRSELIAHRSECVYYNYNQNNVNI